MNTDNTSGSSRNTPWAGQIKEKMDEHGASVDGLESLEAASRLKRFGANTQKGKPSSRVFSLIIQQISSPIVMGYMGSAELLKREFYRKYSA